MRNAIAIADDKCREGIARIQAWRSDAIGGIRRGRRAAIAGLIAIAAGWLRHWRAVVVICLIRKHAGAPQRRDATCANRISGVACAIGAFAVSIRAGSSTIG